MLTDMLKATARSRAASRLVEAGFAEVQHEAYIQISVLLGYRDLNSYMDHLTDKHIRLLEQLAGPYGLVIYKMLLANRGEKDE